VKAALITNTSAPAHAEAPQASDTKADFVDKAITTTPRGEHRLHVAEVPDPVAGPEDLLVRIERISIEGGDLMFRQFGMGEKNGVLGYAASGEVVGLGEKVQGFTVGQKVVTFAGTGSHATLRAAPAATCFAVPFGLDLGVAAAIPVGAGSG